MLGPEAGFTGCPQVSPALTGSPIPTSSTRCHMIPEFSLVTPNSHPRTPQGHRPEAPTSTTSCCRQPPARPSFASMIAPRRAYLEPLFCLLRRFHRSGDGSLESGRDPTSCSSVARKYGILFLRRNWSPLVFAVLRIWAVCSWVRPRAW
jgi:hypothetical protein